MKNRTKISKDLSKLSADYKKKNSIGAVLEPYMDDIKAAKLRGVPAIRVYEVLIDNGLDIKKPTFYKYFKDIIDNKKNMHTNKPKKSSTKKSGTFRVANDDELF
ncbi:MAG: hypothetical protein MK008_09725 [Bdellovibrionales bacterium]|nr:hypothetical protein [Bdellovibrionales bacterium]